MSKNKKEINISKEIKSVLRSKERFGMSKKAAKSVGKMEDYIFSYNSAKSYNKVGQAFATYVKEKHGSLRITLNEAYKYAADFVWRAPAHSASTMMLERSALAKIYGVSGIDICDVPERKRKDITRSRERYVFSEKTGRKILNPKSRAGHFSEKNNQEIVDFVKATGTRRFELAKAKGTDLIKKNGKYYLKIYGKGGKWREAEIIGNVDKIVKLCKKAGKNRIFERIPGNMDVHHYRSLYGSKLYLMQARDIDEIKNEKELYRCKGELFGTIYDRNAMLYASRMLGHNRVNVIASHYLRNLDDMRTELWEEAEEW